MICGMVTIRLAGYLGHTLFRIWRSSAYFKKEYSFQLVDINDSWMQFEVLEDVHFHGSKIRLCSIGPGEVVHFIPETRILLCRQVIDVRLNGDMAYIYVMLGHSAKFAHDAYRCISVNSTSKLARKVCSEILPSLTIWQNITKRHLMRSGLTIS